MDEKMEDAKKLTRLERQEKVDKIESIETTAKNDDTNVELPKPKKVDSQREERTMASDIKQNETFDNYSEGSVKASITN